jgi:hypothetical protein
VIREAFFYIILWKLQLFLPSKFSHKWSQGDKAEPIQSKMSNTSAQQYLLGTWFYMPTSESRSELAIAIGFTEGKILQSLYTLMMEAIVIEIWTLVVLAGMALAWKGRDLTHNMSITNVAVWNLQSSPFTVAKTMFDHLPYVPGYALLWMTLAVLTVAGSVLASTFIIPLLIAGQAAPANPYAVFAPYIRPNGSVISLDRVLSPASMRALGAVDAIDPATGGVSQQVEKDVIFTEFSMPTDPNVTNYRLDWTYSVSGKTFGLQHVPDLNHTVQGSCYTEYSWYKPNGSETVDTYEFPLGGNSSSASVDLVNSKTLLLTVYVPKVPSPNLSNTNVTFAFLVSSAHRLTYARSFDPWYLTDSTTTNISNNSLYEVQRGRPMLSCWQSDTWTVDDQTTSIMNLDKHPRLALGLINVLQSALQIPRIIPLTQQVGTMALQSSFGMQGRVFDGEVASVASDLKRLVYGSYIATTNVFLDSTLFNHGSENLFVNLLFSQLNTTDPRAVGAGDFVIYGTDHVALRLSMLILVPVILVFLFLLVMLLSNSRWFPWPWRGVRAMDATVLYNNMMDPDTIKRMEQVSDIAVASTPLREVDSKILIRPKYDHRSSSYSWHRIPTQ